MSTVALIMVVEVKLSILSELSILISEMNDRNSVFESPG